MKSREVADWLMDRGVSFEVRRANDTTVYEPANGFYKSDGMAALMDDEAGDCYLHARYGTIIKVESPWDVVRESAEWHEYSKDRFDGWAAPAKPWDALYELLAEAK